jgi:hypothetical protein
MGVNGNGPKPYRQVKLRTIFLRVPTLDWASVKRGRKGEFRSASGNVTSLWNVQCPTPVVAYKKGAVGYDSTLMVLEGTWREKLMEISPESLAAEGFRSFEDFRRYWMRRERRKFMPLVEVSVYRVRPWREDDRRQMGDAILERLYGEFF